jgi:hypothetical protein
MHGAVTARSSERQNSNFSIGTTSPKQTSQTGNRFAAHAGR